MPRDASPGADQEGLPPAGDEAAPRRRPASRMPPSASRRSPRRTRCCRTRRSGTSTTGAATRSVAGWGVQRRLRGRRVRLHQPGRRDVRPAGLAWPTVAGPPRAGRPGPAGPGAGRGGVRHHQAAAGGHRRALPALQRRRCGRGLAAGALLDLPRPGRRDPRAAVVHRRHPDHPALPDLPRLRHGDPQPVPGVRRRRPGAVDPDHQREDPAGGQHRQPDPPGLARRGRPGRRTGRRPVRRAERGQPRGLPPRRRRPRGGRQDPDDGRRAWAPRCWWPPWSRICPTPTRKAPRCGCRCRPAPSPGPGSPSTAGVCPGCGPTAGASSASPCWCRRPTRIDDEQRELLRQLAELREETRPEVSVQKTGRGVFGRLRDAFAGQ